MTRLGFTRLGSAFLFLTMAVPVSRAQPSFFEDATSRSGIDFVHENGATPEKFMPETMGAGAVIFDFDNDDWPDLLLVNGGSFVDAERARAAEHHLYRNRGDGTFERVVDSGIGVTGFGMGACAADYDADGWSDVYLTSVDRNRLYRNEGGRFADVTETAGVGSEAWSSSCAFADVDNDGDLDLYVVNYVDFAVDNNKRCTYASIETGEAIRAYCHPNVYNGVEDVLYRNNGDGTFTDATAEAGLAAHDGKGLGVVFTDFDQDGWIDIYVANDSTPNFMFHNNGDGSFTERGVALGVAVSSSGEPLAGMGTDVGDLNGDGWEDIIVTNLDRQTHSLYQNFAGTLFADITFPSGVGSATLPFVGFGAVFLDFDNDGDLDLAIANGDVTDNVAMFRGGTTHRQRNLLLENDGSGRFTDAGTRAGPGFALERVSRALAAGDLDNDGDIDLVVANNGDRADVLVNTGGSSAGNFLVVALRGNGANLRGVGARLELHAGEQVQVRTVKAGSSYLAQNDGRVHFGLGPAPRVDRLEVVWPGGEREVVEGLEVNRFLTITRGQGVTAASP